MIRITKTLILLLLAAITLNACYPGDSIPIDDLDTSSTFYKAEDFSPPPASVAIVWEVVQQKNDDANDLPYKGEVDSEILNTTLDNLVNLYGESNVIIISETATPSPTPSNSNVSVVVYDENDPEPNVDVVVSPSIILRRETVGTVYPGYPWWGGGGWWGGGWWGGGCYYCGYPPSVSIQRYDIGTVVLDMVDLRQLVNGAFNSSDVPIIWVAVNRGLISSSSSFNKERTVKGIDQSFEQSPYLN